MPNTWILGRTGKCYVKAETAYGTTLTLAATDAVRHLGVSMGYSPLSRANSPARFGHPSLMARYTRRATASFDLSGLMYPSGVIGTVPELDAILTNALGSKQAITPLSTTIAASPAPAVGGATVASPTGLAIGQWVLIKIAAGVSAGTYARILTGVSTAALTWSPNLPAAPVTGDTLKSAVGYTPTTAIGASLNVSHFATAGGNREMLGCAPNQLEITLDANEEPTFKLSGPARMMAATAQSVPAAFTTVGAENPPSGLTGSLTVGASVLEFLKATVSIDNGLDLQNVAFGTSSPAAMYRKGMRKVEISIDAMVSDQVTLMTAALAGTSQTVLLQVGTTEGHIWAIYLPAVEFDVPDTPDGDETNTWSFKGVAQAVQVAGNDEISIGAL